MRDRLLHLGEHKDVSAFYLSDPSTFPARWRECLAGAPSLVDEDAARSEEQRSRSWAACENLARRPNILDAFATALRARGVAGDPRLPAVVVV